MFAFTATAGAQVLFGDQSIASYADSNSAGSAQAFQFTASASGATHDMQLYVRAGTTATSVKVGIYNDSGGAPGALVATGTLSSPAIGAWNDVSLSGASVTKGQSYWLAVLPEGGQLNYYDTAGGNSASYVESTQGLSALPQTYAKGNEYNVSPISAYVNDAPAQVLIGDQSQAPGTDSNSSGVAQAFAYTAGTSGVGSDVKLYVGSGTSATSVQIGIYSDASGKPGALLASGTLTSPTAGAWNDATVSDASLTQGQQYWIALLPEGGTLNYLDTPGGSAASFVEASHGLSSLPQTYASGTEYNVSPASVYVLGSSSSGSTSGSSGSGPGSGSEVFVAQNQAGSGSGADCADAHPASWFNSASNWGSGAGQVGPGVTVNLCGTISSPLVAQGSGSAGSPITVFWQPGASLSEPACPSSGPNQGPGCFDTNGQSYLTLDGGQNGSILSTANGYNEPNAQQFTMGVWAVGSSNLVIKNLNISGMWQINGSVLGIPSASCGADTGQANTGIQFGSGSNITIDHDTLDWDRTAITWYPVGSTQSNVTVSGSTMSDDGTSMTIVANINGGGSIGPVSFHDNTLSGFAPWETGNSACVHDDGIHGWDSSGDTPPHYNGVYIYNNRMSGLGAGFPGDATSYLFLEGATSSTVFADASSPIYVFNNVISGEASNALIETITGTPYIFNNTVTGTSTSQGSCIEPYAYGPYNGPATVENNAVSNCGSLGDMYSSAGTVTATPLWDYNVYGSGTSSAWQWGHSTNAFSATGFGQWRSSSESNGDTHSCATFGSGTGACSGGQTAMMLNSDGSPQAGSPVLNAGTNLSSLCTGNLATLCSQINGTSRPTAGSWDAGAY